MSPPSPSLRVTFLAHLRPGAQGRWASVEGLEDALRAMCASGQGAWPGVALRPEVFVRHVAERWPEDAAPDPALHAVRVQDLYLACACLHDAPGAVRAFERKHLVRLAGMLAHLRPTPDLLDEVRQALLHRLFTAPAGEAPRIAAYAGRGALALWVRAAAVRVALNLMEQRAGQARRERDDDALLTQAAAGQGPLSVADPEMAFIKRRDREKVKGAFRAALLLLDPEQRTLLRLHYLDGLSLSEIGALHGAHKTTILRRLGRAEACIAEEMRRSLGESLRLPPAEVDSLIGLVLSQLARSLGGVAGAL